MFEKLFVRPTALRRHRERPLAEERRAYLTHLAEQGAARKTLRAVAATMLAVVRGLSLADGRKEPIALAAVEAAADRWARRRAKAPQRRAGRSSRRTFAACGTEWLAFLGRLSAPVRPAAPFDAELEAFAAHRRCERGLSPTTICGQVWYLRRFLDRVGAANETLGALTIERLDALFQETVAPPGRYARITVRHFAEYLRAFFRFAESRGWCRTGLSATIRGPRVYSQTAVPTGPSWEDVKRLLAAAAGGTPAELRARAILMLLAVYGLRSGEVQRLRLEDLDWERERLVVAAAKNGHARTYPLTRPVGDAILRYLREARPKTARREVFLCLAAPARPVRNLWIVVGPRLRRLGLSIPHHGPHALRHACATHLLARGMSLPAIGEHLGHRDPDATRIYAKVDLAGLRRVADFDLGGLQ